MSNRSVNLLFGLLLLIFFFFYNYYPVLFLRPQSTHQWAQCDRISIAYNYYAENRFFLSPAVHYVGDDNTGQGVSEMPLLQFIVAQFWKIFGFHEWMYRLLEIIIMTCGLYALFGIFRCQLKNKFLAFVGTFFVFTSPILVFYGNNFLPDVPALSFTFIGLYFFFRFKQEKRMRQLLLSTLFFLLAGWLKASSLICFVAVAGIYLLELSRKIKFDGDRQIFSAKLFPLICFSGLVAFLLAWYGYAIYYNQVHKSVVFLTDIRPPWIYTKENNQFTMDYFLSVQVPDLFQPIFSVALLLLFLINLLNRKYLPPILYYLLGIFFIGILFVFLLFYGSFRYHNYYMITFLIPIAFILLSFFVFMEKKYPQVTKSKIFIAVCTLILLFNVGYASTKMYMSYFVPKNEKLLNCFVPSKEIGYWKWFHWNYSNTDKPFETIQNYNRSLGIKPNDRVLCLPDKSFNISLYMMNQKGFTINKDYNVNRKFICDLIKDDSLKYIFISSKSVEDTTEARYFLKNKIGSYRNVDIYKMDSTLCQ
jgi:hypothetical protein